jgi:hypothetical protein
MDYASSLLGLLPGGRRTPGLKELLGTVDGYLPPDQVGRIREAAEFGTSVHQGQRGFRQFHHPQSNTARHELGRDNPGRTSGKCWRHRRDE